MNLMTKKTTGLVFITFLFLTGCAPGESSTGKSVEVDSIIEEQDTFSFDLGDSPLITFQSNGMQIINAHNIPGEYPFPFEAEHLYEEFNILRSEEILTIEANDEVYELEILGPRLFRDNENDLELNTNVYLLDDVE